MAADQPTTTAGTPKVVRDLELEAMRLYRAKYPDGEPWHELADTTRFMWVEHAEKQRAAGVAIPDTRAAAVRVIARLLALHEHQSADDARAEAERLLNAAGVKGLDDAQQ